MELTRFSGPILVWVHERAQHACALSYRWHLAGGWMALVLV